MVENRFDVLPVESRGRVDGYFHTLTWNDYSKVARSRISKADLISCDTDVREVVRCLAEQSRLFFFLSDGSDVKGLISVVNLNRRPVKVWLFNGEVYKRDTKDDAGLLVKKRREKAPAPRS